ncbi:hypothetical protein AMK21_32365 [Streptomyces sp. CB00316]|nr:hypothetical protein AMK21_32365 [Streptomyces sp. CB00316]
MRERASANLDSQVKELVWSAFGGSCWSWAGVRGEDHPSAVDIEVRQDEHSTQKLGGAGGIGAELSEGPPVLEVRDAVFDRRASDGQTRSAFFCAGVSL